MCLRATVTAHQPQRGHPAAKVQTRRPPVPPAPKPWAPAATRCTDAPAHAAAKHSCDLQLPDAHLADVGVIGWLVDGAAIMNQMPPRAAAATARTRAP